MESQRNIIPLRKPVSLWRFYLEPYCALSYLEDYRPPSSLLRSPASVGLPEGEWGHLASTYSCSMISERKGRFQRLETGSKEGKEGRGTLRALGVPTNSPPRDQGWWAALGATNTERWELPTRGSAQMHHPVDWKKALSFCSLIKAGLHHFLEFKVLRKNDLQLFPLPCYRDQISSFYS